MKIPWYLATQTQGRQLVICRVHFMPALRRLPHLVFCQGGLPIVFGFEKPNCKSAVAYELFWQLRFAMSQSRHSACGYLLTVAGTTRLPPPRSDDCRCRSTAAYLSDTKCPLGSQLTSISGGHSPISLGALVVTHAMLRHLTSRRCIIIIIICRLGRQLVADSSAPAAPGNGG